MGRRAPRAGNTTVSRDALVGWESKYVPAEQCRAPTRLGGTRAAGADSASTLVVRATGFDSAALVAFGELDQWLVIDRKCRVLARMAL